MVVVSSKRTDNQMQDPQGGEFRMTARAQQLSSMATSATFYMLFDLNGADTWPVPQGDIFSTEIELVGVSTDQSAGYGDLDAWKGTIYFYQSDISTLVEIVPTGGTLAQVALKGSALATPLVEDDGSGSLKIKMTVVTARDANWRGILKGLYVAGDTLGT